MFPSMIFSFGCVLFWQEMKTWYCWKKIWDQDGILPTKPSQPSQQFSNLSLSLTLSASKRALQPSLLLFLRDDTWGWSVLAVCVSLIFFWRRMFHSLQNRGSQPKAIISLPHCFASYDQSLTFQFNLWHHSDLLPAK